MVPDNDLKQQLDDLFGELKTLAKVDSSPLSTEAIDAQQYLRQLLGLFSEPDLPPSTTSSEEAQTVPPSLVIVRDDVVTLLTSHDATERCEAVQNLIRLESKWAIDPLLYAAADREETVASVALEGLLWLGERVNQRVVALTEQPATPLHAGGTAYISYLLSQPFVHVPAGAFLMGSDPATEPLAEENEQPQHQVGLPGFWISRHPVTVAQYHIFLQESGYRPRHTERAYGEQHTYPVADVTWYDTLAYCEWLSQQSGLPVTLPSEAEWEKAARGSDGRRYPWGNQPPTEELCSLSHATPVGEYSPQGDSPFGCADMVGNVWEWTRSAYRPYPYDPADGREALSKEDTRVVRGLTFNNAEQYTRCAYRYRLKPILHLRVLGFRLVVAPQIGQ